MKERKKTMANRETLTEAKAPWLIPVLIFGGVLAAGVAWSRWASAEQEPPRPGWPPIPRPDNSVVGQPDTLAMISSLPFTLTSPARAGRVYFLSPAGNSEVSARRAIQQMLGWPTASAGVVTRNVIVPPFLEGGPPAFADLWAATFERLGPASGTSVTFTLDSVSQQVVPTGVYGLLTQAGALAAQGGLPMNVSSLDDLHLINGALYFTSLLPMGRTERELLFIPVVAEQVPVR